MTSRYTRVRLSGLGHELPEEVVPSVALERRLLPLYERLHLQPGQLEALTGIRERRYWPAGTRMADVAARAGRRALEGAGVAAGDLEALVYAGVCRDAFEPATACAVADALGVAPSAAVYDLSNACLGVLNGILDVANRIELGQVRAGLVVTAETAREIVDVAIEALLDEPTMERYVDGLATLTGGSGAAAVLVTDESFGAGDALGGAWPRLLTGVSRTEPRHHELCRWGLDDAPTLHLPEPARQHMRTDAPAVMRHGVALARATWDDWLGATGWRAGDVDRVVCHQVGGPHRATVLPALGLDPERDEATFPTLGNMGTASLPVTASLGVAGGHLRAGQRVGFLGIGSGLNCLMLGWDW